MNQLARVLEYTYAENSKKQRLMDSNRFPSEVKNLLMSEGMEEGNVLEIEVNKALVDGASKRSVIRKAIPTVNVGSSKALIPSNLSPSGVAECISEAATIPDLWSTYTSGTLDVKKYATKIGITEELVEDHEWDLVTLEVERAGALLENALNKAGMTELLDGHHATIPADVDPGGDHLRVSDLAAAKESLKTLYWGGGKLSFIGYPTATRYLLSSGNTAPFIHPNIDGKLFGIDIYELATKLEDKSSNYWDSTDGSSHYYGILLDYDNYAYIGMRDDIHLSKEIKDPIHDITNLTASMRFDVKVINSKAAVRILTK